MKLRGPWCCLALSGVLASPAVAEESPSGSTPVAASEDHGYIGIGLDEVPEALAHHLGIKGGAMVLEVAPDSPAALAGLRVHDVIVDCGGENVRDRDFLREKVRSLKPGEKLKLALRRGAEAREVEVVLGSLAAAVKKAEAVGGGQGGPVPESEPQSRDEVKPRPGFLGIGFGDVPELLAEHLGLASASGVIVNDIWAESPAAKAKLSRNDIVISVDGYEVKGSSDFVRLLGEHKAGDAIKIEYLHKGKKTIAEVTLAERPVELGALSGAVEGGPPGSDVFRLRRTGPGLQRKGRVIIEGPNGKAWKLDVPDSFWKAHELSEDFETRLQDLRKEIEKEMGKLHQYLDPDSLRRHIKKLTKDFGDASDSDFDVILESPGEGTIQSQSARVRIVENDLDITIDERNGQRTVTVIKAGQKLGENLPWDQLDKLPAEVRARVEKAATGIKTIPTPPPPVIKLPEAKIRA